MDSGLIDLLLVLIPPSRAQVIVNMVNATDKKSNKPRGYVIACDMLEMEAIDGCEMISPCTVGNLDDHEVLRERIQKLKCVYIYKSRG